MTAARPGAGLTVRELSVSLPLAGRHVSVVDRISFDFAAGEIVALVGESGCGKSLAAAALLGLAPAPVGRIQAREMRLAGLDLLALDERGWRSVRGKEIGMIFQEPLTALDPVFTVGRQLVEVIRRHRHVGRGEAARAAANLLREVGLADTGRTLRSYPHELSGGMRQRILIAMALSCGPKLLVADEPTTALDVTTQAQILDLLERSARAAGTAVLLVTHDLAVARQVCDRALVMYGGRIVEEGPIGAVLERPVHPYTAGLVAAMPILTNGTPVAVQPIPGAVPPPDRMPSGCRFNDRCARSDRQCRERIPALLGLPANAAHRYACHHPLGGAKP
jgi:oligopeptide/dipeptide ABC transporter ATP-binding protein